MLISTLLFIFLGLEAFAANPFPDLETKITFESSNKKIKKIQLALSDF
jgi:hypothetical protein